MYTVICAVGMVAPVVTNSPLSLASGNTVGPTFWLPRPTVGYVDQHSQFGPFDQHTIAWEPYQDDSLPSYTIDCTTTSPSLSNISSGFIMFSGVSMLFHCFIPS